MLCLSDVCAQISLNSFTDYWTCKILIHANRHETLSNLSKFNILRGSLNKKLKVSRSSEINFLK